MKTVMCYGDSNTFGYDPTNGMRYPRAIRWTGVLQKLLGENYQVISEGCNGRTTIYDDPLEGWKNGLDYLKPCLNSHKPLDWVVMMLGSNDLKTCFHASAEAIAKGASILVDTIQTFTAEKQGFVPKILLLSPPEIGPAISESPFRFAFDESAITRSKAFAPAFQKIAEAKKMLLFKCRKRCDGKHLGFFTSDPGSASESGRSSGAKDPMHRCKRKRRRRGKA